MFSDIWKYWKYRPLNVKEWVYVWSLLSYCSKAFSEKSVFKDDVLCHRQSVKKCIRSILIYRNGFDENFDWGQEKKGTTEDEMAEWHHQLDGHEFEWPLGVGDGQGGLVCCNSWGRKESVTTEWLNWLTDVYNEDYVKTYHLCFLLSLWYFWVISILTKHMLS